MYTVPPGGAGTGCTPDGTGCRFRRAGSVQRRTGPRGTRDWGSLLPRQNSRKSRSGSATRSHRRSWQSVLPRGNGASAHARVARARHPAVCARPSYWEASPSGTLSGRWARGGAVSGLLLLALASVLHCQRLCLRCQNCSVRHGKEKVCSPSGSSKRQQPHCPQVAAITEH
jgi:hypothetical protein